MEAFVYHLFKDEHKDRVSKQNLMPQVRQTKFVPDVEIFFKELPDRTYTEDDLINELNTIIQQRGRADAIGGTLERIDSIPPDWQHSYQEYFGQLHG